MSLAGQCGSFFLITINIVFLLLGLGLMIVGVVMKLDIGIINQTEVMSTLNEVSLNSNLKFGHVASSLSVLIICLGAFIFLLAFLGVCGACCKNECLLIIYFMLIFVILAIQVAGIALWFIMQDKVENKVKDELRLALELYDGVHSKNEMSVGWDLVFIGLDCCGVEPVGPNNKNEFVNTDWYKNHSPRRHVPYSCCTKATEDNYKVSSDVSCENLIVGYRGAGCYQAVKDLLKKNETTALALGITLLFIEFTAMIFACMLCRSIDTRSKAV
ncbi:cd63 antigen [Mactra antiquata]